MRGRLIAFCLALTLVGIPSLLAPPANPAVEAGANAQAAATGKVAFVREGQIWTLDLATNASAQLTTDGTNLDPRWSPDGKQIVFVSNRDQDKNPLENEFVLWHVYLMSADGSNQRLITARNQMAYSPIFTPDGGYLIFIRDYGYSGKLPPRPQGPPPGQGQPQGQPPQGQGQNRPPNQPTPPPGPRPPSGTPVVVPATPPPPPFSFTNAISLVNLSDNTVDNIAATEQPKEAPFVYVRISPDGQTLIYQVDVPTPGRGIEVINIDGSNKRTLYYGEENRTPRMYNPYFLNDGQRVLYSVRWINVKENKDLSTAVEWVAIDGSSRQPVFEAPGDLQAAVPSPDGKMLLVTFSKRAGDEANPERIDEIFLYTSDGTQLNKVTDGFMPDWWQSTKP